MSLIGNNPNASAAALAGALSTIIVWIVGVAGLSMPAEVASAFTTLVAALLLFVGRGENVVAPDAAASAPPVA